MTAYNATVENKILMENLPQTKEAEKVMKDAFGAFQPQAGQLPPISSGLANLRNELCRLSGLQTKTPYQYDTETVSMLRNDPRWKATAMIRGIEMLGGCLVKISYSKPFAGFHVFLMHDGEWREMHGIGNPNECITLFHILCLENGVDIDTFQTIYGNIIVSFRQRGAKEQTRNLMSEMLDNA